ncbi:alpha/beta hydrolase [Nocardia nova]|uniref:Alpha/beta hydrolase n=1 Tax=Nocardia nova TaxID=37330 RepID=A0A2S6AQ51_9NOCA|nr:alpha/beta hydrolase [Nocardia nova]PPJ26601.1 alpha/beta hydrolase [Nocardia nova]PPJ37401.1 alpha/beta hydrolase [Nocardia nova]
MSIATTEPGRPVEFRGAGGLRLAGDCWGNDGDPVVLLLHGTGQTRHSWKRTGIHLAAKGFRVIAIDTRGHGESAWAPSADDYALEVLTQDVCAVVDEIGEPVTIVGASLGGLTSLQVAADLGVARVRKLVLVDVVPRIERSGGTRIRAFMQGNPDGFASLEEAADAIAAYLPHRKRPHSPEGLRRNLRQRPDGRWRWHWDPQFLRKPQHDLHTWVRDLESAAARLGVPILVVRGALSDVVSREAVENFLTVVPAAQFVELSGAGHTAAGDDNDAFTEAVVEFV